ncbi:MAG: tRNA pseudouridine(38-40) synthase TruA [Gemmatimonadaceae bacterium]
MPVRTVQLVLHYDGAAFAGWQRQPAQRTVQGALEAALLRLCTRPVAALGAGRTDAGVHARGQAVTVRVAERWTPESLRRALNAVLPDDIWVAAAHAMHPEFHARYSALARRYSYHVGLDDAAASPFRRRYEWGVRRPVDRRRLDEAAAMIVGVHCFRGFAVLGTAPEGDDHRCHVTEARWADEGESRLVFQVEANRFLHHMVRFLVGTMMDVGTGRRTIDSFGTLLQAADNRGVSPPAPPHALFLERVSYPGHLYLPST